MRRTLGKIIYRWKFIEKNVYLKISNVCWMQLTGGCKIRVLSITAANSYPLIDLASTKREDSDLG